MNARNEIERTKFGESSPLDSVTKKTSMYQQLDEIELKDVKRALFTGESPSKFSKNMINFIIKINQKIFN